MKVSQRFISLLRSHLGTHQQENIQNEKLKWSITKVRSIYLPQRWRGPVFVSGVVLYSLDYDAPDVMDNDNLTFSLEAQIQISIALIGTVKKTSIDTIVLAKRWGITPEKAQKIIWATTQRKIRTMLHPLFSRWFRSNDQNTVNHCLAHHVFSDTMFASRVSPGGNRFEQVYATDFG